MALRLSFVENLFPMAAKRSQRWESAGGVLNSCVYHEDYIERVWGSGFGALSLAI